MIDLSKDYMEGFMKKKSIVAIVFSLAVLTASCGQKETKENIPLSEEINTENVETEQIELESETADEEGFTGRKVIKQMMEGNG